MTYETSVPFSDDPKNALQVAAETLAAVNMRIGSRTDSLLVFDGPGMSNTNQNPLLGISHGQMTATGGTLSIRAELGAVRRMIVFLCALIVGIEIVSGAVLGLVLRGKVQPLVLAALIVGPVAPWAVLIPLIARWMKRRTIAAIDTFLNNAATIGARAQRSFPQNTSVS